MHRTKNILLLSFLALLFFTGCTSSQTAQMNGDGTLVIGEVYTLESGKTLYGDVAVVGSSFNVEEGAVVNGDISLIGSTTEISGEVNGDIFAMGGSTTLSSSAVINGDINQMFHDLELDPGVSVSGDISTYSNPFSFPKLWNSLGVIFPYLANPEQVLLNRLVGSAIFCFIACLIIYLMPKSVQNCVNTIKNQPGTAWGVGLLVFLVIPLFVVILAITICLSPIALILLVAFMIAIVYGWIALAVIIGEKFSNWLYLKMSAVLKTLIGALLISIVVSLLSLIPCLGVPASMIAGCYGLGGVVISRFGKIEDKGNKKGSQPAVESDQPEPAAEAKKSEKAK